METPFEIAIPWIRIAEGVDSDHPADRGGLTRYGISQAAHPDVNVADLTWPQALEIYQRDYWNAARCGEFPPPVALTLFDATVNHRPGTAVRLVQHGLKVTPDGVIGPITIAAGRSAGDRNYLVRHLGYRAQLYSEIVAADSSQAAFLRGWFNRLFRLQAYILMEVR